MFALTVFLSAFLLFQVQPLIGKYVLPWFGGGPAIWTTCLLFFQVALLAGYAYAHAMMTWLRVRTQAAIHIALLALAIATLPIIPAPRWQPADPSRPILRIVLLLAATLGLPWFALSATAPLVQAWFARAKRGASPWRLYALSNAGSLLALLSYPIIAEPLLSRRQQCVAWSVAFAGFAILCALCAIHAARGATDAAPIEFSAAAAHRVGRAWRLRGMWLALPAAASVILIGTTNALTLDVAPVPLLWVAPLAVYLLTFIICFDHPRWYDRRAFAWALAPAVISLIALMLQPPGRVSVILQIVLYCAVMFVCCMICHGELVRLRPQTSGLTGFYLAIAAGGALGGVFVALIAPRIFTDFAELRWGVFAVCVLSLGRMAFDPASRLYRLKPMLVWFAIATGMTVFCGVCVVGVRTERDSRPLVRLRNFYGVIAVAQHDEPANSYRKLEHGHIIHGLQFLDDARRREPSSYYGPGSGLSRAVQAIREGREQAHIGVVGLGAGSIAAFAQKADAVRFYEIDPDVQRLAHEYFTYLSDCPAPVAVIMGDGRLSLEREPAQGFDVLVLDAFSGDSVPAHLLTREAFTIYLRHLKGDGVIAVNVTNKYLDLQPLMARVAEHFHLQGAVIVNALPDPAPVGQFPSAWVLLSADRQFFRNAIVNAAARPLILRENIGIWTDDRTNLFQILRR